MCYILQFNLNNKYIVHVKMLEIILYPNSNFNYSKLTRTRKNANNAYSESILFSNTRNRSKNTQFVYISSHIYIGFE